MPLLIEDPKERQECLQRAAGLPRIALSSLNVSDLIMLGIGAFSPLEGFIGSTDYGCVVENMRLSNNVLWPIPITLAVGKEEDSRLKEGQEVALVDSQRDEILATMVVEEKYSYDRQVEARNVFGTEDQKHPGVKKIFEQGDVYLAGPVRVISESSYPDRFAEYARPAQTRRIFEDRGWKTIAAFQTRNPIHRSHEYLIQIALEICDGVLAHPIVGRLKPDDIPAETRMKCYQVLLGKYFPKDRVLLKAYPMEMRYGGPREAILHAIIRLNFGCTHLIVGRDHAGVGGYYGPFAAQDIFDGLKDSELAIKPLKLDWTFWCYKCNRMASTKTCPHLPADRCLISGTELRKMLSAGDKPPPEFSRPEVLEILIDYYREQKESQ